MTRADLDLCQARIAHPRPDGTDRCRRAARHEHYSAEIGTRLELCSQHYTQIVKREHRGSSRDLLDLWTQPPVL